MMQVSVGDKTKQRRIRRTTPDKIEGSKRDERYCGELPSIKGYQLPFGDIREF
jgi:hypothetical protein